MPEHQKSSKNIFGVTPFHLVFLVVYPLLSLYATNINQIPLYAVLRSAIFLFVIGLVIFLFNFAVFRNLLKAALMTSVLVLLFHFYGHIYGFLEQISSQRIQLARHSVLTVLWIVIGALFFKFLLRQDKNPHQITKQFNAIGGILITLVVLQIIIPQINFRSSSVENQELPSPAAAVEVELDDSMKRDVYYIIVDAYTRADVLNNKYDFDNSKFLGELESLGFTILDDGQSNYDNTFESMTSALNMSYLDDLGLPPEIKDFDKKMALVGDLLPHSRVRSVYEAMGYPIIAFHTKATWANWDDADIYYQVDVTTPVLNRLETLGFHDLYLKTTWTRILFDTQKMQKITNVFDSSPMLGWIDPNNYAGSLLEITDEERFENIRYMEYKQNLYSLDSLQKVPDIPGNKFVYAHMMATHSSFVFNEDGSYKEIVDESNAAYVEQIQYVNKRLIEIVETILEKSTLPPVIVIQADHGYVPGEEKVAILHAMYLPEGGSDRIYADLTPVNTFRIILTEYFGYDLDLIPDRSFFRDETSDELVEVP